MTWAQRVGDLATQIALVLITFGRIFTLILKLATEMIDGLVTNLAEKGEEGIKAVTSSGSSGGRAWLNLPGAVAWGAAAIVLRTVSIVTVLARQIALTLDDFLRALSEGQGSAVVTLPVVFPERETTLARIV